MRLHWTTDFAGVSISFGFHVHNDRTRRACVARGVVLDDQAPVAISCAPPMRFFSVPGKINVLYTAWESPMLPGGFRDQVGRADLIVVPASFLVGPFRRMFPGKPVVCVPLGVDHDQFPFVDRAVAPHRAFTGGRRFRFLWVGAPNHRKGPIQVLEAWKAFAPDGPAPDVADRCELYLKYSVPPEKSEGVRRHGNIIIDDRRVGVDELRGIYQRAHCFVFPTVGEGFGLTAAEAAATGLPVIFPPSTSMPDLFDDSCGWSVATVPTPCDWSWDDVDGMGTRLECQVVADVCDTRDLVRKMLAAYRNPALCTKLGGVASARMRSFTWERTADLLIDAIRSLYPSQV